MDNHGNFDFMHTLEWKGDLIPADAALFAQTKLSMLAALNIPDAPTLEEIRALEAHLCTYDEQLNMLPEHAFAEGVYGRLLRIPAGAILTGKMHRRGCLNVLVSGHITVWTVGERHDLHGPAMFASGPGIKRIGVTHTDTIWVTAHATDLTDPVEVERDLTISEPRTIEGERA